MIHVISMPKEISWDELDRECRGLLKSDGETIDSGRWQSQDVSDPNYRTIEVQGVVFQTPLSDSLASWQSRVKANLPWAEDHFQERVSGIPHNPPPSHEWWPFNRKANAEHMKNEQFSHTYPERFWPKWANSSCVHGLQHPAREGVRYEYGDLTDVIDLLQREPLTRQAYLPVWFPEDTGVVHGERVPCTLGYLFSIRNNQLSITYYIRSCDYFRHFADDVYMAGRLAQWMIERLENRGRDVYLPGVLTMYIESFHCFEGDRRNL